MNDFDPLVDEATALFEGAGVQVYTWDGHAAVLVPSVGNAISAADEAAPRPIGVGAAGCAAQQLTPVLIADYGTAVGGATAAGRAGVLAAMGVPLFSDGQLIGAISVGVDHERLRLGVEHLAALQMLANGWSASDPLRLLSAIYELYCRPAFRLALRLLGDRTLAEEVVQDVFLFVWRSHAQYDSEDGSLRTQVLTMVCLRAIDIPRLRERRAGYPLKEVEATVLDGAVVSAKARLRLALDRLHSSEGLQLLANPEFAPLGGSSRGVVAQTLSEGQSAAAGPH